MTNEKQGPCRVNVVVEWPEEDSHGVVRVGTLCSHCGGEDMDVVYVLDSRGVCFTACLDCIGVEPLLRPCSTDEYAEYHGREPREWQTATFDLLESGWFRALVGLPPLELEEELADESDPMTWSFDFGHGDSEA